MNIKNELRAHILFLFIIAFVGFTVFLYRVYTNGHPSLLWPEHRVILAAWILGFIVLSLARVLCIYVLSLGINADPEEVSWCSNSMGCATKHYAFMGAVSIPLSFPIFLTVFFSNEPNINANYGELWLGYSPILFEWFLTYIFFVIVQFFVSRLFGFGNRV